MAKIILIADKKAEEFNSFEAMFQAISEKGIVVTDVKDGIITTKDKKEFSFGIMNIDNTEKNLKKEIEVYRDKLRESILPLMKQGIVTKEQAGKLKEQFEFLDGGKK